MAFASSDPVLAAVLKRRYADYRRAPDIEARVPFLSPICRQICRSFPSYGAGGRQRILDYLYEASGLQPFAQTPKAVQEILRSQLDVPADAKGYYTIRPLGGEEVEFGSTPGDEAREIPGSETLQEIAIDRKWVGMRVDMWTDGGVDKEGVKKGLLVKVQYWWRKENDKWVQIVHDIMYLGPRDGTEGTQGEILE